MASLSLQGEELKAEKGLLFLTAFTKNKQRPMGRSKFGFTRQERLSGKKRIEGLFKKGSSFYLDAVQVRHLKMDNQDVPHQVLVTVSKRHFKRAVDRNLIKRRMREAYRLNKHLIAEVHPLYIGFVYISRDILTFHDIQDQLITGLKRLERKNAE